MSWIRWMILLVAICLVILFSPSLAMDRKGRAAGQKPPPPCTGEDCEEYEDYDLPEKKPGGGGSKPAPKPNPVKVTPKPVHPQHPEKAVPVPKKPVPAKATPKPAEPHKNAAAHHPPAGNKHPATTKGAPAKQPPHTTPKYPNSPRFHMLHPGEVDNPKPPQPKPTPHPTTKPTPPTTHSTTAKTTTTTITTTKQQIEDEEIVDDVAEECDDPDVCKEGQKEGEESCSGGSCGGALFITPYLESGDVSTAVEKAKVSGHPELSKFTSYSGFFTVNQRHNSSLFFWFFPAMNKETSAPLIIWLQGDAGTSTLFGIFSLHGPYKLTKDLKLKKRKHTWIQTFNVLYIDNPVGTGFSFTNKVEGHARNQEDVAEDLYNAVQQFFQLFPDFRDNSVYICGESYGAKYAAALSFKIHTMGEESLIDLKGIALGNPLVDPETMLDYSPFLYHIGLIDENQAREVNDVMEKAVRFMHKKEWMEARDAVETVFGDPYVKKPTSGFHFPKMTGMSVNTHFLRTKEPKNLSQYKSFAVLPEVRKAIHVGNLKFQTGEDTAKYLREDFAQSVKPWITTLINSYRMMIYSGNMDIIAAYPLVMNFLHSVKWRHVDDFSNSTRMVWKVNPKDHHVAGYVHHVKNFYEVMVKNAGHVIAYDQPRAALDMISRFIWGRAFNTED